MKIYFNATSHTEANSKYIESLSKEGKESEVTLSCPTLCDPWWTVAHQAPVSMGFPRQEYWSGLPFPPPGDLPASLASPALAGGFFTTGTAWELGAA